MDICYTDAVAVAVATATATATTAITAAIIHEPFDSTNTQHQYESKE